jgi:predicted ATP-dependent endonuclease of OLD family
MTLNRLEILGYRGFKELGSLELAAPNGESGSGLTILTGPNNAGKSCVLECLRARVGGETVSFTTGTRNTNVESVNINFYFEGRKEEIKSVAKGSSETVRVGLDPKFRIFVLPSRRAFSPYFGKGNWSRDAYLNNTGLPSQRSSTLAGFEYRLFNIINNPEKLSIFNDLLGEVLGSKPTWMIDRSDQGQYFLKFFNGSHTHSSDGMGEGVISVFSIVDSLYDSNPGDLVAIDEPELSLHPSLQKRVSFLLNKFSKDRQIVISTHSPYFVDLHALENGAQLARITTTESVTRINQLTKNSKDSIRKLSEGNLYNPHIFGLDARELFFQEEKIILTEGQEDVLLYPKVAEQVGVQIPGNFFGWGVGGAGNLAHLCLILKDLGFKKVAGLLDSDKTADAEHLKREFPDFYFCCIPAKDIRTKAARKATEKVAGLLDEEKKLKSEFHDRMKEIFSELSDHMD